MQTPSFGLLPEALAEDQYARIVAEIDRLQWEPVHRQTGADGSESQWCRTYVNCRYLHGYIYFPSPYARLAGLDDSVLEHYSVYTGTTRQDEVTGAETREGSEDEDAFFLQFPTLEHAVAFCLDDRLAPMEVALHRRHDEEEANR